MSQMLKYFRKPGMSNSTQERLTLHAATLGLPVEGIQTENCYYVATSGRLTADEEARIRHVLRWDYYPKMVGTETLLREAVSTIEYGPRMNFTTSWSDRAVSICRRIGVSKVVRFEHSVRLGLPYRVDHEQAALLISPFYDRMLQMVYESPLSTFESGMSPEPVRIIPLLEQGLPALWAFNEQYGCSWNEFLVNWIASIFYDLGRNPTDVELFKIAQMNSSHSRHWEFLGVVYVDGVRILDKNLLSIIKSTQQYTAPNSVIAFHDDSSAIRGREIELLMAEHPGQPSELVLKKAVYHPTATAETHNFPSGVAPYPGAATGTGGRIRDNQCVGRGGLIRSSGFGVCTGNYHILGFEMPWEMDEWTHPHDLASPLDIRVSGTDGGYDYGNCFGEPNTHGFIETFGMQLPEGYRSWYRPVVYTFGTGGILDEHVEKGKPEKGMLLVHIGGNGHRVGMGGSSASSREQDTSDIQLNDDAVQRDNPVMGQLTDRLFVACIELRENNPLISAHDLGAGGVLNAFTELADPAGALIKIRNVPIGDYTLSVLEIFGNESQERDALMVRPEGYETLKQIADRAGVPIAIIGFITGDGLLIVHDDNDGSTPVKLPLAAILGDLPPAEFQFTRLERELPDIILPPVAKFREVLRDVLRLPSVASKRDLVTKVDHTVKGLTVQDQWVGPHLLALSDYAMEAHSYVGMTATGKTLGEQPTIGLINAAAAAHMTVAEAVLSLAGVGYTELAEAKGQLNWMLAINQPGQGAWLVDSAYAVRDALRAVGIGIDGGKDSLSMASDGIAPDGSAHRVFAPGLMVLALYALVEDHSIRATVNLKQPGNELLLISCSDKMRLGGTAFAQATGQLGNEVPDIDNLERLQLVALAARKLLEENLLISVHDTTRVGPLVTLIEMAMAGDRGVRVNLDGEEFWSTLFNGEASIVIEVPHLEAVRAKRLLQDMGVTYTELGEVIHEKLFHLSVNRKPFHSETLTSLRRDWEESAYQLDRIQSGPACAEEEWLTLGDDPVTSVEFYTFNPDDLPTPILGIKPKVAVLWEQGSNGDREMAEAFRRAGFASWDVNMNDISTGTATLDDFQFIVPVGGFSFGDTLGAGTGWAATMKYDPRTSEQLERFFARDDRLSLWVCNGCQAGALYGVPGLDLPDDQKPLFVQNRSGRFEHRYVMLEVAEETNVVMLQGMQGSKLGIYVAHGEGQLYVPTQEVMDRILREGLAPLRYVGPDGKPTESRPYNPNGSPHGIAGLCSPDGKHLLLMPHPERTFLRWQMAYSIFDGLFENSPWARFFANARAFF